ncbi:MAG: F0F1 ATP synthase subunit A [Clostridiales bacterium]|nr:F0F1 ATP synthase subunit A [Clostridiales bacterium]
MGNLAETIIEEMQCETVFSIGPLDFSEGVVVSWIVIAVLVILSALLTRNLQVDHISKRQAAVEFAVLKLESLVEGMVGEKGRRYVPYLVTILLYISLANIFGIFGFKPPTKELNVPLCLAIFSIVLVQVAGIREKGVKGWLHGFTHPVAIVTPFNILDLVTRPLSLCMRLFGNVLGAFVIMELIEAVVPAVLPMVFSLYFDFFDGILQAYVFVFLTSIYIKEALE